VCTLCASLRPADPLAERDFHIADEGAGAAWNIEAYAGGTNSVTSGPSFAPFTMTQIASQLTDGYWNANGESRRAFDLDASRTLVVDLSGLDTPAVRTIALMALEAWRDVTGIRFVEATGSGSATVRTEFGDAAGSISTTAVMNVGENFNGTISTDTDIDFVRVRLVAGETYVIRQDARGTSSVDSYLTLRNAQGNFLTFDDDTNGRGSQITFTATTTGNYYLDAQSYDNASTGAYSLSVRVASASADITFDDEDTGAYSTSELAGGTILSSFINMDRNWDTDAISMNSYWYQTMVHEIGHALGLGHAGNYNGAATWDGPPGERQSYDNDSWQATVMSYFAQGDGAGVGQGGFTGDSVNPNINASYAYLATLMPADIIAIQNLYGTNVSTRAGNTVYGNNSNVTGYLGQMMDQVFGTAANTQIININNPVALTIYDTGGSDTLDFSNTSASQRINLNALSMSNVYGLTENVQIASGVVIESAIGGRGSDRLIGNSVGNNLIGNAGRDTLEGGSGNDTLNGGTGIDRLDGGAGADLANYALAAARVTVDLLTPTANTGEADGDVLISISGVRGTRYGDLLRGNDLANSLQGMNGGDVIYGRGGNDTLTGGAGLDTLYGGAGSDNLYGGSSADRFIFAAGADRIFDFANNSDTIVLDRDLWGGTIRSVQSVLNSFAEDLGSAVILRFAGGNTLRIDGLGSISGLLDDIAFI
jgi:Ca2+-binding RTX toxin-like protein